MECSKLRTEYQINPIGIDIAWPRLSWQVLSDKRNVAQTGYRMQFSKTSDFSDIFHDTEFVSGSQSSQIKYVGPELTPFQRLYWRVMVETTQGNSEFSKPAFFETGLMDAKWEGGFIEPSEKFTADSPCPVLKRKFSLKEELQSARLYITALGMYQAYINEKGVDQDILAPGWTSYNNHIQYQTYDVTDMLVCGENILSVILGSGWYMGRFECSNEKVNRLFQNILWGQKGNFLDVPTDCPQRDERLGWTGDTQVFASAACCNSLVAPFYAKWLKDLVYDQMESGAVPDVVPDLRHDGQTSSAWGDAATIVPNLLYDVYGDKRLLKDQYPSMKKWVEFIRANSDNETIWATARHYGDWLAKEDPGIRTPKPLISTVFYYNSVNILAKAAKILGYEKDANEYEILSEKIKKAFNREFVTDSGHVSGRTQTAYTIALHFGLLDEKTELLAAGHLAELVRKKKHRITTGFVGTPYITHVLSEYGYNEDAYSMLLNEECPGWLYPVNLGATTIWERWDAVLPDGRINPSGMNSFNHYAYGSIGYWLYAKVLGIEPIDGYSVFSIAPKPSRQLDWAEGGFETLYGRIEVRWSFEGDKINIQLTVPCNTRARVCLPFAKLDDIVFEGKASQSGEDVRADLGSGKYKFSYVYSDT